MEALTNSMKETAWVCAASMHGFVLPLHMGLCYHDTWVCAALTCEFVLRRLVSAALMKQRRNLAFVFCTVCECVCVTF